MGLGQLRTGVKSEWALAAILLVGAAFRFYGLNWDAVQNLHPDERAITMVTVGVGLPPPEEWSRLLDPHSSPLNPRFFAYGSLPLYFVRATAELFTLFAPWVEGVSASLAGDLGAMSDFDHITLLGRALSAVFDLFTIYLTYLLGRRVYDHRAGLLAAALVAFTVFHVQLSHFYAVDTFLTTFVVAALYFAVGYAQGGRRRDALFMGLAFGAALATKVSVAPLGLALLLAIAAQHRSELSLGRLASPIVLATLGTGAAFFIGEPYALLDFSTFIGDVVEQGQMVQGALDYPYTRQYVGTAPYLYHITQSTLWAMGLPLGVVAWGGLLVALRRAWSRPRREEWVLLAWALPYFLITGAFFVKFLRYLLPLFPVLYVLGADMLFKLQELIVSRVGSGRARWAGRIGWLGVGGVVAAGLLYCLAFLSIYSRPHTRVAASEWIYRNVPRGSTLAEEHWDDNLPLGMTLDGQRRSIDEYRTVSMNLYDPDNPAKYEDILNNLRASDLIVLSSNRLYGSIPKSPLRYPLTTRYYELLFEGQLGFSLAKSFTSYPSLLGITLVDEPADESFTVYDHPQVLIFEKVRDLSDQEGVRLFADVRQGYIPQGLRAFEQRGRTLLLDRPVDTLPAVNDGGWNAWANAHPLASIIVWWLVVQTVGLAALPLTLYLLRWLPGGAGYIFSKSLGLLAGSYLVWMAASLRWAPNTVGTAWASLLIVAALSIWVYRRQGQELRRVWAEGRRLILLSELVFSSAYLYLVGLRILNPDLWQPWTGGEKPMEFAFLNAILRSAYFPPYDPYFAHGYINYYYYGLYLVAVLSKLSGIAPAVAFNLAVPTLFAMSAGNAFALAYSLTQRLWAGLAGSIFVALLGNLDGARQVLELLPAWLGSNPLILDYWRSSRVIPNTINEFPYWSFLFADLHPHMIGIPFTILVLALAYALLLRGRAGPEPKGRDGGLRPVAHWGLVARPTLSGWDLGKAVEGFLSRAVGFELRGTLSLERYGPYLATALALGAVSAINTWDLPTYALLLAGTMLLAEEDLSQLVAWLRAAARAAAVVVVSLLLYWPFFAHYQPLQVGLGLVQRRTELDPFLTIWGTWLFFIVSYLLMEGYRARAMLGRGWALAALGVIVLLFVLGELVLAFLAPMLVLAGSLLLVDRQDLRSERFLRLLIFLGVGILLGSEVVFLRDFLAGSEYQRMNTLFKFYIQAWVLLGLAGATLLPRLLEHLRTWRRPARWAWIATGGTLLLGSAIFLVWGTPERVLDRFPGQRPPLGTLDGLAFMSVGTYSWPDADHPIELRYDHEAIRWFQENVGGTPVVAEAPVGYYRELGLKVSSFTGLPTLVGMHQSEQRWDWQVGERNRDAVQLYETSDPEEAIGLIRKLRVAYIYLGQLEQILYSSEAISKFEHLRQRGFLELAYENPKVRVYRVAG